MEYILELILSIIFAPVEPHFSDFMKKVKKKNKLMWVLIYIALFAFFIGVMSLLSFLIRGYWL